MKTTIGILFSVFLLQTSSLAAPTATPDDPITIVIDSLTNVKGNGALEACGTAIHKSGIKPLLVTLKHGESFYTVLTAPNGKWCVVFKRWLYNGQIDVSATTFQNPGAMEFRPINTPELSNH